MLRRPREERRRAVGGSPGVARAAVASTTAIMPADGRRLIRPLKHAEPAYSSCIGPRASGAGRRAGTTLDRGSGRRRWFRSRGSWSLDVDQNHALTSANRRRPRPLDAVAYFWKSLTAPSSRASIRRSPVETPHDSRKSDWPNSDRPSLLSGSPRRLRLAARRPALTELLGRMPRPSPERAREVRMVRVAEVERDVEDLGVGLLEERGRDRASRAREELLVGVPGFGELALQRANAGADGGRGRFDAGIAVPRQRLDDLADRPDEIEARRGELPLVDLDVRRALERRAAVRRAARAG